MLYHICHKVVSFIQEWFLYYVLYHICHKVVSVIQEWFLYYVLYVVSLVHSVLYAICCFCSTGMVPVLCAVCHKVFVIRL